MNAVPQKAGMRRLPIGAEVLGGATSFRVWAPARRQVSVVIEEFGEHDLNPDGNGYFAALIGNVGAGARYRFRLDAEQEVFPDPASRCQPEGPHGPSEIVDPLAFTWRSETWPGVDPRGQVIYELHIGTFTPEGTWAAAIEHLPKLRDIGITLIEMMPVNDFSGRFGWGYDGVGLYAPTRLYGRPDDLRRFVDAAHAIGLGVILDVVYNHIGPDGNYLEKFSPYFFTDRHRNEWGRALDFDGPNAAGVREFFIANAAYWIEEYRFDGLRLDATQALIDESETHVVAEIAAAARAAAPGRSLFLVAESEPEHTDLARPRERGGRGLDAIWNDDFHHCAIVATTGRGEAYYSDFAGSPQELVSAAKWGTLFQGQRWTWQKAPRGMPGFDLAPTNFVNFLDNHDQVANSGRGRRLHQSTTPGRARALTALLLLAPQTPMFFQGQEFWASAPFLFFADFDASLNAAVRKGRGEFLAQFPALADPAMRERLADPGSFATFEACKLDWREFQAKSGIVAMHRDLLCLRREDSVFAAQPGSRFAADGRGLDGAVIGPEAFVLRFFGGEVGDDRLLLVNLGRTMLRGAIGEPLLAPPEGRHWALKWSSEDPLYGGEGTPPVVSENGWLVLGHAAFVLTPAEGEAAAANPGG